jgi:hypothetical protein
MDANAAFTALSRSSVFSGLHITKCRRAIGEYRDDRGFYHIMRLIAGLNQFNRPEIFDAVQCLKTKEAPFVNLPEESTQHAVTEESNGRMRVVETGAAGGDRIRRAHPRRSATARFIQTIAPALRRKVIRRLSLGVRFCISRPHKL